MLKLHQHVFLYGHVDLLISVEMSVVVPQDALRGLSMAQPSLNIRQAANAFRADDGLHCTALGMTTENDVAHLQYRCGILDGSCLTAGCSAVWWNNISSVP